MPSASGQQPRRPLLLRVGIISAITWAACQTLWFPRPWSSQASLRTSSKDSPDRGTRNKLQLALADIQKLLAPLQAKVDNGELIQDFGGRADHIIGEAKLSLPDYAAELEIAIDAALRVLYVQQLAILHQQVVERYRAEVVAGSKTTLAHELLTQADADFVAAAQSLVRSSAEGWSFDFERSMVHAALDAELRREESSAQEQSRAGRAAILAADVIRDTQIRLDALHRQLSLPRGPGPWALSASLRVPRSPFQLVAQLQRGGRASLDISLAPDRDPVKAEAGMVQAGSANLGVSFNLGR